MLHHNTTFDIHKNDVCSNFILYHKASPQSMLYLYTIGSEKNRLARPQASPGKKFLAEKLRTFDRSKLTQILELAPPVVELNQWCETVAVVTTISSLTDAVKNILEVLPEIFQPT